MLVARQAAAQIASNSAHQTGANLAQRWSRALTSTRSLWPQILRAAKWRSKAEHSFASSHLVELAPNIFQPFRAGKPARLCWAIDQLLATSSIGQLGAASGKLERKRQSQDEAIGSPRAFSSR